jgi:hypothetical protein
MRLRLEVNALDLKGLKTPGVCPKGDELGLRFHSSQIAQSGRLVLCGKST